jgi:hypothetical protein
MFNQPPPSGLLDNVSDILYRWRGIEKWPETEACIQEIEWISDAEFGPRAGMYRLGFRYITPQGIQTGSLTIGGIEDTPPFTKGDTFDLRYHPRRPSRYYQTITKSREEVLFLILCFATLGPSPL